MSKLNIWIVEDTKVIRDGIKNLILEYYTDADVRTFSNGESIVETLGNAYCPDLLLLDLGLPQLSGLDTMKILKNKWLQIKILIFTVFDDNEHLFEALRLGACGYILKTNSYEQLKASIDEALGGAAPMSREIAIKVLQSFSSEKNNGLQILTQREREVLGLLANGLLYKEIADKLIVSQNTIKNHLHNIYEKLHVNNRSEAIGVFYKNLK